MRYRIAATVLALALGTIVWIATLSPSHAREWRPEQAILPSIRFAGDSVHIRNVRANRYRTATDFEVFHEDRSYDLRELQRVWFVVSPFSAAWRGPAHVFLSFEFTESRFLAVSVEARREKGENYSIWKGLLRRFELIYVIGDERDLIALRAVHWNDPTYLYPVRASPEQARAVFTGILRRAAAIEKNPEFYHTITNNCTTNIVDQVNEMSPNRIRHRWELLLPGYSDDLAHALGLIDTDLARDAARARFRINDLAAAAITTPEFSTRIRQR